MLILAIDTSGQSGGITLAEVDAGSFRVIESASIAGGTFSAGMDLKAFLSGETPSIDGRGLCGITETPPRKPLIGAVEGWAHCAGIQQQLQHAHAAEPCGERGW